MLSERAKVVAAVVAAAASVVAVGLMIARPTWLFPIPTRAVESTIPLPEAYVSGSVFEDTAIDTEPTEDQLDEILEAFSKHIERQARNHGFSDAQIADLGAVTTERLRGMLDLDPERDYELAARRGLTSSKTTMMARARQHGVQLGRLRQSPFGLKSATIVPQNRPGGEQQYEQLGWVDFVGTLNYSISPEPEYDRTGIGPHSLRVEVLFPLRVPVLDRKKSELTRSPSAVVVFSYLLAWAETETRGQWVPEKYTMYSHGQYFPKPEDIDQYVLIGYPIIDLCLHFGKIGRQHGNR